MCIANKKTVLSGRTQSETSCKGSNGGLPRASRTTARSHRGDTRSYVRPQPQCTVEETCNQGESSHKLGQAGDLYTMK